MSRPVTNFPGMSGVWAKELTPTSVAFPKAYREYVEKQLKDNGVEASFQQILRLAMLSYFPIPTYENETARMASEFLPRISSPEGGASEAILEPEAKPLVFKKVGIRLPKASVKEAPLPKQEKAKKEPPPFEPGKVPVDKVSIAQVIDDDEYGEPEIKCVVTVSLTSTQIVLQVTSSGGTLIAEHRWARKDFHYVPLFYEQQSSAFLKLYEEKLVNLSPEKLDSAICEALEQQFNVEEL